MYNIYLNYCVAVSLYREGAKTKLHQEYPHTKKNGSRRKLVFLCESEHPVLVPTGNPLEYHEEVLYLQPLIPPKRFDISPL